MKTLLSEHLASDLKEMILGKNILMREDEEAPKAWTLAELLCMSQGETFIGC